MDKQLGMFVERQMSGLRVDYAKFKYRAEYDISQQYVGEFKAVVEHMQLALHAEGNWKAIKLGSHSEDKPLWSIEVWGALAECVLLLPAEPWTEWLDRLDVRQAVSMDNKGRDALYSYLKQNGTSNRMLNEFNQRRRQKVGGRSGGGAGFAVGSHKSPYRWSVYQRADEPGAIEFQMCGERIGKALDSVYAMSEQREDMTDAQKWGALFTTLHAAGWREASKVSGLSRGDIIGIVSGEALPPQDNAAIVARIEEMVGQLPQEERVALHSALQLSIFGV